MEFRCTPKNQIESGKRVWNILQLRVHKSIIELKKKIDVAPKDKIFDVDLTYLTSRKLVLYFMEGDISKSGGIATNIGICFYDMLSYLFGDIKTNTVHIHTHDRASGYLEFDKTEFVGFIN